MPSVLLVEDDDKIRNMYAFALRQEGFTVTDVGTAGEGLSLVQENTYDVILLDMLLSGMSGLDLLRNYNVALEAPQTKVVALTNMESEAVEAKATDLGVVAYLNKANNEPQQLVAFLKKLLGESAAPAAGATGVADKA
ncbi:MAG TPA: response regulator [Candidatus Saccharimonadia bacterium]|nr:response regulator [Candidatus Saccharimonadia bacterium]